MYIQNLTTGPVVSEIISLIKVDSDRQQTIGTETQTEYSRDHETSKNHENTRNVNVLERESALSGV